MTFLPTSSGVPVFASRWWLGNLAIAVAYFLTAEMGLHFAVLHGSVSPFWPGTGMTVALMLIVGTHVWPGVAAGALVVNFLTPVPALAAVGISLGTTLEALTGAMLVRVIFSQVRLRPFAELAGWLAAGVVAPAVSAVVGVGSLWLTGTAGDSDLGTLLLTWWLGDAIGLLVVAPAIWALWHDVRWRWPDSQIIGKLILLAVLAGVICWYVFYEPSGSSLLFLTLPLLLAGTVAFGGAGAKVACLVVAVLAILAAGTGHTLFDAVDANSMHLQVAAFVFALALTAQLLSVLDSSRHLALPAAVLVAGWLICGWIYSTLNRERLQVNEVRFDNIISESKQAIEQRMTTYTDALRGGVSLFASSQDVTREEWRQFVDSLELVQRYPGIDGMGAMEPVRAEETEEFTTRLRREMGADFAIRPVPGAGPVLNDPAGWEHFVVTRIEPEGKSGGLIGLDAASEQSRQTAARVSRDYGQPQITGQIDLVDQDGRKGFILYMPMYQRGAEPLTVHDRRVLSRGWVFAPFVTEHFLRGVLGLRRGEVELTVFDGLTTDPEKVIFSTVKNSPTAFERTGVIQLAGQQFTCGWNRGPEFESVRGEPLLNAITLAILPALLAGLVMSLQTMGRRASDLADERTKELREANRRLEIQIAERQRAETEAQQARAIAERANAAKSDFLATMSHEIRTPMNGVIGYTELLAQSPLTPEQRAWTQTIQNSGRALLAIINDILDFSKIEAGKLAIEHLPFDPAAQAGEVCDVMRSLAEQKGLAFKLETPGLPARIFGDPNRFKQILLNLLANAVKFTERGSVRVTVMWLPGLAGSGTLRVAVADTGVGIPEEKRDRLFHRFSQVDSSTTRRFGGTGLGLAICKHLTSLMDGTIGVESVPGEGTTVWFELPAEVCTDEVPSVSASEDPEEDGDAANAGEGRRVLLAEDVPANQKLATLVLTRLGCTVELAGNGREAVEKALHGSFDVIYMDVQMPVMDGFAATRAIRASGRNDLPIVALTASALEGDRQACLAAGMNDYMTKPFSRAEFVRTLRAWSRRT